MDLFNSQLVTFTILGRSSHNAIYRFAGLATFGSCNRIIGMSFLSPKKKCDFIRFFGFKFCVVLI